MNTLLMRRGVMRVLTAVTGHTADGPAVCLQFGTVRCEIKIMNRHARIMNLNKLCVLHLPYVYAYIEIKTLPGERE